MARHGFKSEAELAARVVNWLREDGWKVYQEVDGPGGIADIVAVKGTTTAVVECKLALNLTVLEQAARWIPYSYFSCIAVPHYTYGVPDGYRFGKTVAAKFGLSVIQVQSKPSIITNYPPPRDERDRARQCQQKHGICQAIWEQRPDGWNHAESLRRLSRYLHDEQQTFAAAGSPTGKRWTPFKGTVQSFEAYVKAHPGCTIKEVCENAKHHWRTNGNAVSSMRNMLRMFNPKKPPFPGIVAKLDPKTSSYKLYPVPH